MTRELSAVEKLNNQLILGQCRIGRNAAREIAERVTQEHGFWDFEERKAASQPEPGRPVLTLLPGGGQSRHRAA
jgi:hypothetical protein